MNRVREKVKPRRKLLYKLFKEQNGYDLLIVIYQFPTLIQLKEFLGGIQDFVTVVGKWVFDSGITFAFTLTIEELYYCSTND